MIVRNTTNRLPAHVRGGFTLLEVLVVVAILVILASVATFATVKYLSGAKEDQATLQMQKIQQAIKAYNVQSSGSYPNSVQDLVVGAPGQPPYLEGTASIIDPWGQQYNYEVVMDDQGTERVVIWTVVPTSGKRLQWPRQ